MPCPGCASCTWICSCWSSSSSQSKPKICPVRPRLGSKRRWHSKITLQVLIFQLQVVANAGCYPYGSRHSGTYVIILSDPFLWVHNRPFTAICGLDVGRHPPISLHMNLVSQPARMTVIPSRKIINMEKGHAHPPLPSETTMDLHGLSCVCWTVPIIPVIFAETSAIVCNYFHTRAPSKLSQDHVINTDIVEHLTRS